MFYDVFVSCCVSGGDRFASSDLQSILSKPKRQRSWEIIVSKWQQQISLDKCLVRHQLSESQAKSSGVKRQKREKEETPGVGGLLHDDFMKG